MILAGHTRLEAARQLGLREVPVHIARGLTRAQARAYRLMDNRASENAEALFPGDVAYVWHGALHATTVGESLEVAGFAIRSQIIWAKERLVLSRGDYHWQHEPCWYAVRRSGKGHWNGIASNRRSGPSPAGTRMPRRSMAPRSRSSACAARFSTTRALVRRSTSPSLAQAQR